MASVSYHSSVLYPEDLNVLRSNYWFNDAVITWWFEWLTHSIFPGENVAFIHPSAVALALFEDDEDDRLSALTPLKLNEASTIFIPVNDSEDASAPAQGSHWSLLAVVRETGLCVHADSGAMGIKRVREVVDRFRPLIFGASSIPPKLIELAAPRQRDGYSCGAFVCAFAEALAAAHAEGRALELPASIDPKAYRRRMASIAESLITVAK